MADRSRAVVLVSVGNTRTRFAVAPADGPLEPSRVMASAGAEEIAEAILEAAGRADAGAALIASVNEPVGSQIARLLGDAGVDKRLAVGRLGSDVPIPVQHTLTDGSSVGQDRLLNALGAFSRSHQACIIIDAGTAVTVDFVDGHGVFHGGAIAPGLTMMRDALHERTAALPRVEIGPAVQTAGGQPFGKTTAQAINLGIASMVVGMAHLLIDRYAEFYEAYPRVIATGGDAPLLFENDPLVEHIVPDLALIGMQTAWQLRAGEEDDNGFRDDP
jgi:type III pantothenate kinase